MWEVDVWVERPTDGRIDLVVKYDQNLNLDNPKTRDFDKGYWGTNRIIIEQGKDHGNYHWTGNDRSTIESEKLDNCGWRKDGLYESKDHHRYRRRNRHRWFRSQIIALDKKCAISGETTEAALDAAHIIPAKKDGNEIPKNGIALRTDIHRLYDKKMFFIHPESGKLKIDDEKSDLLSKEYKKLLKKSERLPSQTLERVRKALAEVWPGDRSRV